MTSTYGLNLFDTLRLWAYRNVGNYGDELTFIEATTDQADYLNDGHLYGRTPKQLDDLAVSVACWTWSRRSDMQMYPWL
ncbi:hypothetical protein AB0M22_45000 [Nocardia sp. NPDC051756]|uniref:hypothetical protein n=1 Tax=Nocardia sp. NPDC051756 TaxID=3154751 RepID=UPI003421AF32